MRHNKLVCRLWQLNVLCIELIQWQVLTARFWLVLSCVNSDLCKFWLSWIYEEHFGHKTRGNFWRGFPPQSNTCLLLSRPNSQSYKSGCDFCGKEAQNPLFARLWRRRQGHRTSRSLTNTGGQRILEQSRRGIPVQNRLPPANQQV